MYCFSHRLVLASHPSIHPCPKTLRCSLGAHTLLILRQLLNSLRSTCGPTHVFCSNNLCAATLPGFHIYYDKTSVSDRKPVISNGSFWHGKTPATPMHSDRMKATEATRYSWTVLNYMQIFNKPVSCLSVSQEMNKQQWFKLCIQIWLKHTTCMIRKHSEIHEKNPHLSVLHLFEVTSIKAVEVNYLDILKCSSVKHLPYYLK